MELFRKERFKGNYERLHRISEYKRQRILEKHRELNLKNEQKKLQLLKLQDTAIIRSIIEKQFYNEFSRDIQHL